MSDTTIAAVLPRTVAIGVNTGVTLLLVFAVIVAVIGLVSLSSATSGPGLIALGCFLAIIGRILQAGAHHKAIMARA